MKERTWFIPSKIILSARDVIVFPWQRGSEFDLLLSFPDLWVDLVSFALTVTAVSTLRPKAPPSWLPFTEFFVTDSLVIFCIKALDFPPDSFKLLTQSRSSFCFSFCRAIKYENASFDASFVSARSSATLFIIMSSALLVSIACLRPLCSLRKPCSWAAIIPWTLATRSFSIGFSLRSLNGFFCWTILRCTVSSLKTGQAGDGVGTTGGSKGRSGLMGLENKIIDKYMLVSIRGYNVNLETIALSI